MRLNKHQIDAITTVIKNVFGQDVRLSLFGSRLNDHAKGGDIDLLVTLDHPIERPALDVARAQAKIIILLGDQKIDIVLDAPNLKRQAIHQIARQEGVALC